MNIFQIPTINEAKGNMIIGVIDCSGSMEGVWAWLADHWNKYIPTENSITITFDTKAKVVEGNVLDKSIYKHGGGGTNITSGFELLEKQLKNVPGNTDVTVLFISDGEDNNLHTLEKRIAALEGNKGGYHINFICLGVGSGFPTFISLRLREKYHNGDETLPSIFLIEYVSEKAFTIKFDALQSYFRVPIARKVTPPVCLFPWREYTDAPYEKSWIMTDADTLTIDGEEIDVKEYHLNFRGITEIFRSWAQMMHLESLRVGEDITARAKKTLALMTSILEELKIHKGVDVFAQQKQSLGSTFYDRIVTCKAQRDLTRVSWFYNDVQSIASGNDASKENQFEAAKRIGMGTIVGNYQQKANALKNITPDEFKKIKEEFKELLKQFPLQAPSEGSARSLRDVFADKTLPKGLDLCQNPFDLFDAFELIGCPVRINRDNANVNSSNAYNIDVKFLDHSQTIDAAEILRNKGTLTVKLKDGKEDTANAVLPLLSEKDADLLPFIGSRLFNLLITFFSFGDADNINEEAYLGLVCNSVLQTLRSNIPDEEKLEVLKKLNETSKLLRSKLSAWHYLSQSVPLNPSDIQKKAQKENEAVNTLVSPQELFLHLINLYFDSKVSTTELKGLVTQVLISLAYNYLHVQHNSIKTLYNINITKTADGLDVKTIITSQVKAKFPHLFTNGELRRELVVQIENAKSSAQYDITFNPNSVEKIADAKNSFTQMIKFFNLFEKWAPESNELEAIVLSAFKNSNSANIELVKQSDLESIRNEVVIAIRNQDNKAANAPTRGQSSRGGRGRGRGGANVKPETSVHAKEIKKSALYKELLVSLNQEFVEHFRKVHNQIIPISQAEIKEHCSQKKIDSKSIKINSNSLLPDRVCCAPECGSYLKPTSKRLNHHMAIWGNKLPSGFHALVRANHSKTKEEIYDIFLKAHPSNTTDENGNPVKPDFGRTDAEILDYIEKLKTAYAKILA